MNERIAAHVDALFANTAGGSRAQDIREELLANLNDKYNDLTASGRNEEEAFAHVIAGIGDIDGLLRELGQDTQRQPPDAAQKRGMFLSVGIALYVLSVIPVILLERANNTALGMALMVVICAAATGFVVYANSMARVRYSRTDNSFVEEYKERVADDNRRYKLKNAATSSLWTLTVVLYFALSLITRWWHITWVIFIIGACVQQWIVLQLSRPEKRRGRWHGILWTGTAALYFIISFQTGAWAWSWLLFLMATAVEQMLRLMILWKKSD